MALPTLVPVAAAVFLLALVGWRCWRIFHPRPSSLDNPAIYFALVFVAMLGLRWMSITEEHEFNADESQMLAQAMRFVSHPVPWRDVDGTTSGPLNSLALTVPLWCGAPATWAMDRLVLFVANCAVVLLAYLSLRCFIARMEAQFALTPLILFFAFTVSSDFVHYSSEVLSSVLIAAGFFLLLREWTARRLSKAALFLLGIILGAIPFAKLQATPLGAFLGIAGLLLIFAKHRQAGDALNRCLGDGVALVFGSAVVPALILGIVAANGALGDFWTSYIVSSNKYAAAEFALPSGKLAHVPSAVRRTVYVGYILVQPANLGMFFFSGMGALAALLGIYRNAKTGFAREFAVPLAMVAGCGATTTLCFYVAGKPFMHYGLLIVPSLALFIGFVFWGGKTVMGWAGPTPLTPGSSGKRWLVIFVVFAIGLQSYSASMRIIQVFTAANPPPESSVPAWSNAVREASRTGDEMSVWGWMAEAYVRTGLPPATRDAIGHYVVSEGPLKEYYRARYLRDLERSRPAIFIDAVGDGALVWNGWTVAQKHEGFPDLAKFIDDNYSLIGNYQMKPEVVLGSIRVYVLKERMAERHLTPIDAHAPPMIDFPPGEKLAQENANNSKK